MEAEGTGLFNHDLTSIVTPVKPTVLNRLLRQTSMLIQDIEFLVDGFTQGFDLCYWGPKHRASTSRNLPFTIGDKSELWSKLLKEVRIVWVAGPFDQIPFSDFIQSPIGLVPKDGGKQTRLIFHLPYDFSDYRSVNHYIPQELCSVKYHDLDVAVNICLRLIKQDGEVVFMSKTNGKSAFCVLPLDRESWHWLIMKAENPETKRIQFFR